MIILAVAILGVIFGSFVNAWVWRLHEQEGLVGKKSTKAANRRRELSVMQGRSMCPSCGHTLVTKDLVPVLSWLWLHGRCRYCSKPISWQYPVVELATGLLFALSYATWPHEVTGVWLFQFVVWLVFIVCFMALTVYDLRWFLLPDKIVFPLIGLAAAEVIVTTVWLKDWSIAWHALLAAAIIFGLFWTLFQISDGKWIGGGDVKLAIVLGLLAGTPLQAFLVIFLASLLGTLGSIPALLKGREGLKDQIPFGPYLLLATILVVLYGERIVGWYQNLIWL